jgi:putative ABC transport system permease protein
LLANAPGFDASNVIVMQVQTSGHRFDNDEATHQFFTQALHAVQQQPGVRSAGFTSQLPLTGEFDVYGVDFEFESRPEMNHGALRYAVTPGYIQTMHIPLIRGRLLDERDILGAANATIVSDVFAKSAFPNVDPIGQQVHIGRTDLPYYTIVGIVGDVKQTSLGAARESAVYVTPEQWYFADRARWLVVRTDENTAALTSRIKQAVWSVDNGQPISRITTMEDLVTRSEATRGFVLIVLEVFASLALLLAAIGLYGVLSGRVNERMREIGVRAALGASSTSILGLIVRQGMTLTALGIVVGVVGAAAASQALVTLLFGVSRLDPLTYGAVITVVGAVSMIACWIPALRAARIDPVSTLRAD